MIQRVAKSKKVTEIFKEFQKHNQVKNLSDKTILYYDWNTKAFLDFLDKQSIADIEQVDKSVIDDFILWQRQVHDNSTTINAHLRAVRVFLYFSMDRGYIPPFKINLIKQESKIVETYTDEDIQRLIHKPDLKSCSFVEHRNWMLVNYFLETGNRLRSVINIKVSDVCFPERKVNIRITKNRHEMETPLTKTLLSILPTYIDTWGLSDESYLFPNVTGEQLTENSIKHTIATYNKKRGVSVTSIHAFRHTFARNYIVTGGSSFKLQALLGHKDLSMTRHYVNLFGRDLASDIDQHSIIERVKPVSKRLNKSVKNKL